MTGEFSPWGALALLLLAALALFHRPLGCLLRLAVRSSVGLAVLALFSSVGHYIGVNLGGQSGERPGAGGAGGPRLRPAADAPVGAAVAPLSPGAERPALLQAPAFFCIHDA